MREFALTRHAFLKTASAGAAAIATSSLALTPESATDNQPFSFVQICDPQLGMGGYEHDVKSFRQTVKQVNVLNPDFVLICGDLVHTLNEQSVGDFKAIKAELTVPCHCAPGNHDVGNEPSLQSLQSYREAIGKDYYLFEHKGSVFVIVNSQLWKAPVDGESEKQDAWLETTLANAAGTKGGIFIVGHYPLFTETPEEAEEYFNLPIAKRTELLHLFEEHGVDAVLGGHTHRVILNEYRGIQFVNGEPTSRNTDQQPLGFRLWQVDSSGAFTHRFIPLTD